MTWATRDRIWIQYERWYAEPYRLRGEPPPDNTPWHARTRLSRTLWRRQ